MSKRYNRIGNDTIIKLKNLENYPLIVKNYDEEKVSNDTGIFYMMEFDVVSKRNKKLKKHFILRSDWYKNKAHLLNAIKAKIHEDIIFKSKLVNYQILKE